MSKSPLSRTEFLELAIRNMEGNISKFPAHPKQPYVQSVEVLTNGGSCGTVGEVMDYWAGRLGGKGPDHTEFTELNWMYAYSVVLGFLKELSPDSMNIYARDTGKRRPEDAYRSLSVLPKMTGEEIGQLLEARPIVTNTNNIIVDGLHRTCAMIGRLIAGDPYLPVYREDFPVLPALRSNPNRMRLKV
jgi:hypothetical protein